MNKEEINLLTIQLFLNYYKKDITERYAKCIDNIVVDNDILYTDERLWITTLEKHIELKKENKELHNKIDKIKSFIITNKPVYIDQKGKPCIIDVTNDLLEMLKGDSGVDE